MEGEGFGGYGTPGEIVGRFGKIRASIEIDTCDLPGLIVNVIKLRKAGLHRNVEFSFFVTIFQNKA